MASAAATLWIATSRLATNFILLPLPNAPRSTAERAKSSNSGMALAMPRCRRWHTRRDRDCAPARRCRSADNRARHGRRPASASRNAVLSSSRNALGSMTMRGGAPLAASSARDARRDGAGGQAGDDERRRACDVGDRGGDLHARLSGFRHRVGSGSKPITFHPRSTSLSTLRRP